MSKTLRELTRDETSLLLYLETRAVDHNGRVDLRHMSVEDSELVTILVKDGFIEFGRICYSDISSRGSNWVRLLAPAWRVVSSARRQRANRGWESKNYRATKE